jgi:hypothetical protein
MTDYLKCFKEYGLSSHPYRQSGRSYNLASYDSQSANSLTVFFYNYTLIEGGKIILKLFIME